MNMFNVNEYFGGRVKSLAFNSKQGKATLGVMAPGEFEFGTTTIERITVVSGLMEVMLPGESEWKAYKPFETFMVPADVRFKVKMVEETAYLCHYE